MLQKYKLQEPLPAFALEGFRIFLRPPRRDDWAEWSTIRARNQDFLKPFEPKWDVDALTREFFLQRLQKQAENWNEGRGNYFLIFKKENGVLIGGININGITRETTHHGSLGYWIDRAHEGQGYMSEAIRLIIKYCFNELKLCRINAASLPHNIRSRNLLQRAGFSEEGMATKYLQINGWRQDHILYSLSCGDRLKNQS